MTLGSPFPAADNANQHQSGGADEADCEKLGQRKSKRTEENQRGLRAFPRPE